jgi:hypothetical protein
LNMAVDLILFCTNAVLWLGAGFYERNWMVPSFSIGLSLLPFILSISLRLNKSAFRMIAIGLLLRTLVCLVAWYQSKDTEFAYWTGLNEDSNRFFLNSYLPTDESVYTTEDKGFPYVNSIVTGFAEQYGMDHYLVNVQIPLVFGVIFALASYAWARQITDEKSAKLTGWLIVLHPIVVGWSVGLMRDTTAAAMGWLMINAMGKAYHEIGLKKFGYLLTAACFGSIAWSIRSMTCFYLFLVGVLLTGAAQKLQPVRKKIPVKSMLIIVCLAVAAVIPFRSNLLGRIESAWEYGVASRDNVGLSEGAINGGGISERLANQGSLVAYAIAAPYVFIAPFPFYAEPLGYNGEKARLVDYIFIAGGVFNLYIMGAFACGLLILLRARNWRLFGIIGGCFYGICFISIITTSQSRWLMAALYPMYCLVVARVLVLNQGRIALWLCESFVLTNLAYIAYWSIKFGILSYVGVVICLLTAIYIICRMAARLKQIWGVRLRGQRGRLDGGGQSSQKFQLFRDSGRRVVERAGLGSSEIVTNE